jgi:GntR family transcriptional regulator, transcriptional repressor for pyruvate dehydrogenase complex
MLAMKASNDQPRRRVRHVRVADTIAADLRSRILAGEFDNSHLPTQQELVVQHGSGLTSVREAMRILEAEGLITIRRGNQGGAEVHAPDLDSAAFSLGLALQSGGATLMELGTALRYLEPVCIGLCAASPERKNIAARLDDINRRTTESLQDGLAFANISREFHAATVQMCGNRVITHIVQSLVGLWTLQLKDWARVQVPDETTISSRKHVIEAHRRIAHAISRADAVAADHAARVHLEAVERGLLEADDARVVDVTSRRIPQSPVNSSSPLVAASHLW